MENDQFLKGMEAALLMIKERLLRNRALVKDRLDVGSYGQMDAYQNILDFIDGGLMGVEKKKAESKPL